MSAKVNVVILLKRTGLSLVSSAGIQTLTYPEGVLRYEEVVDGKQFTELSEEFLKKFGGRGKKVLIILSDELVFQKTIPRAEKEIVDTAYKAFLAEVPFEETKLAKLKIYEKDRLCGVAANADDYLRLKEIIEKGKGKVEAVIPAFALGVNFNESGLELNQVLKDCEKAELQKYNFLNEKVTVNTWPPISREKVPKAPLKRQGGSAKSKIFFSILLIILVLSVFILGLIKYRGLSTERPVVAELMTEINVSPKVIPSATPSTTPVLSSTPPAIVTKAELNVRVLNGSGISGQAGIVKKKLEDIGFKNIQTGNVGGATGVKTLAEFSSRVGRPVINEVLTALSNSLDSGVTEATRSGEIDILITTR